MSQTLVDFWKSIGIPFSRADDIYVNIDSILHYNKAQQIDLIGMGYVYTNPDYYQGTDAKEKLIAENDNLLDQAAKHPDRVTPYYTVDPLQDWALEELERCYRLSPDGGLKMHFSTSQVYLTEPVHLQKVKPIFQKAAALGIPMLLHFDNWHPKFGPPDLELLADSILQDIPAMTLKIAHFGTSGGFNDKTKRFLDTYIALREQGRFLERHTILMDISAVALDKDSEGVSQLSSAEFQELNNYIYRIGIENIVFGTDYPLYNSDTYRNILIDKVGLTDRDLKAITTPPN